MMQRTPAKLSPIVSGKCKMKFEPIALRINLAAQKQAILRFYYKASHRCDAKGT